MKKILIVLILILCIIGNNNTCTNADNGYEIKIISKEELIELFPKYSEEICNAYNIKKLSYSNKTPVIVDELLIKDDYFSELISLNILEDGSIMLLQAFLYTNLSSGVYSSNNATYTLTNGGLTISSICYGNNKAFSITGICSNVYKYSMDKITSINSIAIASYEDNSYDGMSSVSGETANLNYLNINETTSSNAFADFYFTYDYLSFEVGNNIYSIIYNGNRYTVRTVF